MRLLSVLVAPCYVGMYLVDAPARGSDSLSESKAAKRATFVGEITAAANVEALKRGVDPGRENVEIRIYNRPSSGDKDVLRRMRISNLDDIWTVYFFEEAEPRETGGDITVYFREPNVEPIASWKWD